MSQQHDARIAIQVVAAGNFMIFLGMMPISVILPTLAHAFAAEAATVSWVITAYLLTLTGLVLTTGRLGDLYGHRRVYLAGVVAFAAGALAAGLAPALPALRVARAVQGIGGALMMGNALALLVALVPPAEHGRAIGATTVAASLGSLLGVLAGAVLVSLLSWRWVFLIVVPAGLATFWLARQLPETGRRRADAPRPDIAGAALLFVLLTTLSLSFTHLHDGAATFESGWPYHTGMQVVTAGLLAAFIVVETRSRAPMMPLPLFRHRRFTLGILANSTMHMTMMGSMFLVPFLIEQGLGRPPATTAMLLVPMQLTSMGASYVGGWLYDRTRSRLLAPGALAAIGVGMGTLGLFGARLGEPGILVILVGTGVATSLFQTANNTAVMAALPPSVGGFLSGMLETSRQLGHSLSVALASGVLGLVAEQALTGGATPAQTVAGFSLAIMSFSLVAFLGVGLAAFAGEAGPRPSAAPAPALAGHGSDD